MCQQIIRYKVYMLSDSEKSLTYFLSWKKHFSNEKQTDVVVKTTDNNTLYQLLKHVIN
jgi:hypothetical protein